MNVDPPRQLDPTEALSLFGDPEHELYGLPERVWFYAVMTARAVESFSEPAFTIDRVHGPAFTPAGAFIAFIIKAHVFFVDVSSTRVKLWTASADDADGVRTRYLVYDGASDNPESWESLLVEIGHCEKFGVYVPLADKLRVAWTQFLAERQRRSDERGF